MEQAFRERLLIVRLGVRPGGSSPTLSRGKSLTSRSQKLLSINGRTERASGLGQASRESSVGRKLARQRELVGWEGVAVLARSAER